MKIPAGRRALNHKDGDTEWTKRTAKMSYLNDNRNPIIEWFSVRGDVMGQAGAPGYLSILRCVPLGDRMNVESGLTNAPLSSFPSLPNVPREVPSHLRVITRDESLCILSLTSRGRDAHSQTYLGIISIFERATFATNFFSTCPPGPLRTGFLSGIH